MKTTFIFAPSFVPCDIFREILKTSLPKENKEYKWKSLFFILKMISETKTSFLWLVIILQCVEKKLLIGKYKCSTKKMNRENNNKLLQRSSYILQLTCRVIESVFTLSHQRKHHRNEYCYCVRAAYFLNGNISHKISTLYSCQYMYDNVPNIFWREEYL